MFGLFGQKKKNANEVPARSRPNLDVSPDELMGRHIAPERKEPELTVNAKHGQSGNNNKVVENGPSRQLRAPAPRTKKAPKKSEVLYAKGLTKSFRGRTVVHGVDLYVQPGETVGLLGPNGAGKTTTFYMIVGLIMADKGEIGLLGHNVTKLPMYRRARIGIGYLPQEASIFRGMTVEQNIMSVLQVVEKSRKKRRDKLEQLLDEFSIQHIRKSPAPALSGGERRRVEIARALASDPVFMLLDEPFAGVDPIAVGDIQRLVRQLTERGIGVLITDHNVRETLSLIDRAYIIHSGKVLTHGSPQKVIEDPAVRKVYLGESFTM